VAGPQTVADLAQRQLIATRARKDFADRLVDLRDAQLALAERQSGLAEANRAVARVEVLRRNGLTPHEDPRLLQRDRDDRRRDIVAAEYRVSALREQASALRASWDRQRRSYDVAVREVPPATPITPPPAPRTPPERPLPGPEGGHTM
jgi:hypothetical protein